MTRHFLRDDDLQPGRAGRGARPRRRAEARAVRLAEPLAGPRTVATIFDKPTLRTQASFAAGIAELGGNPMMVDGVARRHRQARVGRRHRPGARPAGVARSSGAPTRQSALDEMAAHAGVPVVNALTDEFHPCQLLADLLTIREHKGELAGLDRRLRRRRRLQHGQLLAARRRHRRHARADRGARGPPARASSTSPGPARSRRRPAARPR